MLYIRYVVLLGLYFVTYSVQILCFLSFKLIDLIAMFTLRLLLAQFRYFFILLSDDIEICNISINIIFIQSFSYLFFSPDI